MKIEEFKKTNQELKEKMKKNDDVIAINDERIGMIEANQLEYKIKGTLVCSFLPYLGFDILLGILTQNGSIVSIANIFPIESFPFLILGGSLVVGTIGRKLFEWKFKTKKMLKTFSTAKTESEKLEEEVQYTVELEKAKNRNQALEQTIGLLNSTESMLNVLSNAYQIQERIVPQTKEEVQESIKVLSMQLKENYDELDVLTTQRVLVNKFWKVRTKGKKFMDIITNGMMSGIFTMLYGVLPITIVRSSLDYRSSFSAFLSTLAPFIIGSTSMIGYTVKRNKDSLKVFHKLNEELGHNALSDKVKEPLEEIPDINIRIADKMRKISVIEIQLQEQKRVLESFIDVENTKEKENKLEYTHEELMKYKNDDQTDDLERGKVKELSIVMRKNYNPNSKM